MEAFIRLPAAVVATELNSVLNVTNFPPRATPQQSVARRSLRHKNKQMYHLNENANWLPQDRELFRLMQIAQETSKELDLDEWVRSKRCPCCGTSAENKKHLVNHIRVHTRRALSLIRCPANGCRYGCFKRGEMFQHLIDHTNAEPYKCVQPGCNASYSRRDLYSQHYREVHGIQPSVRVLWGVERHS